MAGELKFKATVDDSDLDRHLSKARGISTELTELFKRTSETKPEKALAEFVEQVSGGNVTGAIESIAGKISGLGLLGSASVGAIGAAVAGVTAVWQQWHDTIRETYNLIERTPTTGAALDQVQARLGDNTKNMTALIQESHGLSGMAAAVVQNALSAASQLGRNIIMKWIPGVSEMGAGAEMLEGHPNKPVVTYDETQKKALADQLKEQQILQEGILDKESKTNEQRHAGVLYGEKYAQWLAIQVKAQEDLAKNHDESLQTQQTIDLMRENRYITPEKARLDTVKEQQYEQRRSQQIEDDRATRLMELKKEVAVDPFKELFTHSQLSFGDLTSGSARTGFVNLDAARLAARRAQREFHLSDIARGRGEVDESFRHLVEGERIKSGIGVLSEKEKMPEYAFRQALDGSEILNSIHGEIMRLNQAMNNLSFTGK